jgi:hypothetical protein
MIHHASQTLFKSVLYLKARDEDVEVFGTKLDNVRCLKLTCGALRYFLG